MALKQQLGKLEGVPAKEIWPNETSDFTPWLLENADLLSDALGVQLSDLAREQKVGDFWADLVGTLEDGGTIVVENQFGKSNHDHLGKLLTYMAAMEAEAAAWLVEAPRQEHVKAISWLNDNSPNDFYLLQFEAIKIGDSMPAPMITLIAGPSEGKSEVVHKKQELSENHQRMQSFWGQLIERLRTNDNRLWQSRRAPVAGWLRAAGANGYAFWYVANAGNAYLELSVCADDVDRNRKLYTWLRSKSEEIGAVMPGSSIGWTPPEGRKTARILLPVADFGVSNESRWPELQDMLIDAMQKFIEALQPHIDALKE